MDRKPRLVGGGQGAQDKIILPCREAPACGAGSFTEDKDGSIIRGETWEEIEKKLMEKNRWPMNGYHFSTRERSVSC